MNSDHFLLLIVSFCLYVAGFFTLSSIRRNKLTTLLLILIGTAYLCYSLFYLVSYYFTGNGIDYSVIYHVRYGIRGAGYTEYYGLIFSTLAALVMGLGFIFFILKKKYKHINRSITSITLFFLVMVVSLCVHPASLDLYRLAKHTDGESFWKYYRQPWAGKAIDKPMNLVLIYAESLERSYFNQDVFPHLIKQLQEHEANSISFTHVGNFPNTGWTIAGMVSSQCGMPLTTLSHGNSMAGMDRYLAGATCMGDLLAAQGYNLSYFGGASLDFAGKGSFYKTHGFQKVMGKKELTPMLPDQSYTTGWGLYDDSLFDLAYDEFENLSSLNQPFGLVLLTLDTHGSDHYSMSCKDAVDQSVMNKNIACTDYLIGKFIDRIQVSDISEDTVIVVASDHLAMRGSKKLNKTNRKNLFMILDPREGNGEEISRKGSTLDLGPTILHALGFNAQLGLGRNLFEDDPTIVEEFTKLGTLVRGWKNDLISFWSFPMIKEKIVIETKDLSVWIDERRFKIPILIQYNEKLQTKIRFQLYNDAIHKTLIQHLSKFNPNDPFLLVDSCKNIKKQWADLSSDGLCYVIGKLGSEEIDGRKVMGSKVFTAAQLKETTSLLSSNETYEKRLIQLNNTN